MRQRDCFGTAYTIAHVLALLVCCGCGEDPRSIEKIEKAWVAVDVGDGHNC